MQLDTDFHRTKPLGKGAAYFSQNINVLRHFLNHPLKLFHTVPISLFQFPDIFWKPTSSWSDAERPAQYWAELRKWHNTVHVTPSFCLLSREITGASLRVHSFGHPGEKPAGIGWTLVWSPLLWLKRSLLWWPLQAFWKSLRWECYEWTLQHGKHTISCNADLELCWCYNELYMMNWRNVDDVHRYIVFEQLIRNFIANRFRARPPLCFLVRHFAMNNSLMTSVLQFSGPTGVAVAVTTSGGFHVSMGVTPIAGWFTIENPWESYFNGW